MEIGIFARTFPGTTLDEILDATVGHGFRLAHFNFQCAGLPTLPEEVDEPLCRMVREAFARRGMRMAAISATFNAIHPDLQRRRNETRLASALIARCRDLDTRVVSLCTGTRDPENMWRHHPENTRPEAWADLRRTLEVLLPVAEEHDVVLGVEPEVANVVNSAAAARRLLDEMRSPNLRIILDGANLFWPDRLKRMAEVLDEAFSLLGPDIEMAHAKDITGREGKTEQAAGTGSLDWPRYFRHLKESGFDGPVMLHNLAPERVSASLAFVRRQAAPWYPHLS